MKTLINCLLASLLSITVLACGAEDQFDIDQETMLNEAETQFDHVESELAIPDRLKYECYCDLSNNPCGGDFEFPVVKANSCRYKKPIDACKGKCTGHCTDAGSHVEEDSEFKGVCTKRKIRPNGMFSDVEVDCDDADEDREETTER
jgi:hypothetical protein